MKYSITALACLCALAVALPQAARADTLDDVSIRAMYAEGVAAMKDAEKTRQVMEKQLDTNYVSQDTETDVMPGSPPQTTTDTSDKTKAIADTVAGIKMTKSLDKMDYKIDSIKYADDRQTAFVSDDMTMAGIMEFKDKDGHPGTAHFNSEEGCLDKVGLIGSALKILQSTCNTKVTLDNVQIGK